MKYLTIAAIAVAISTSAAQSAVGDKILVSATETGKVTVDAIWTEEDRYGVLFKRAEVNCRNSNYALIITQVDTLEDAAKAQTPAIKFSNSAELTGYGEVVREACVKALGK